MTGFEPILNLSLHFVTIMKKSTGKDLPGGGRSNKKSLNYKKMSFFNAK